MHPVSSRNKKAVPTRYWMLSSAWHFLLLYLQIFLKSRTLHQNFVCFCFFFLTHCYTLISQRLKRVYTRTMCGFKVKCHSTSILKKYSLHPPKFCIPISICKIKKRIFFWMKKLQINELLLANG